MTDAEGIPRRHVHDLLYGEEIVINERSRILAHVMLTLNRLMASTGPPSDSWARYTVEKPPSPTRCSFAQ